MDGILPPPQNQAVDSCCVGRERCLQTYLGFGDRCRSEQKPARGSTSNPPGTTRKILSRLRMPMPRPWMFLGIVHRSLPGEPAALRQPAPTIAPIVTGVRKGRHSQLDFGTYGYGCVTLHGRRDLADVTGVADGKIIPEYPSGPHEIRNYREHPLD
ncbi:uncharacterized protein LOC133754348 isoform X3 [Lepus europaeus]|uniref:uncharacterized protein LOC133754348 isoform X3 n=1 Tax=Lepus europaeus TaxID=9983 RepID=UPI002B479C1D|nr:uncharacterized protein LOC133754348 isoform X3 [Lepus europaeus]